MSTDESVAEILARTRRMETRLTKFMAHQGFDAGAKRPALFGDKVLAPGYHTTIADLFATVPEDQRDDPNGFDVYIGDRWVATIYPEEVDDAGT